MKNVVIAGGSGFIGKALTRNLEMLGYKVVILTRQVKNPMLEYHWDPRAGQIDKQALKEANFIINLAGAGISDKRWTNAYKEKIKQSRVSSTSLLVETVNELNPPLKLFISGSAVGIYGDRPGEILKEDAAPGQGFLPDVGIAWEKELEKLNKKFNRSIIRLGIVITQGGGMMGKFNAMFRLGFRPHFIGGTNIFPGISLGDLLRGIVFLMEKEGSKGVYNFVSPEEITLNKTIKNMQESYGKLGIPIPLFKPLLRFGAGEGIESLFYTANVYPDKLMKEGYEFKNPRLEF